MKNAPGYYAVLYVNFSEWKHSISAWKWQWYMANVDILFPHLVFYFWGKGVQYEFPSFLSKYKLEPLDFLSVNREYP